MCLNGGFCTGASIRTCNETVFLEAVSWRAGTGTQHFVTSTGRASLFPLLPLVTIAASLIGSWWCWGRLDRNVMLEVVGRGLWVLAGDAGE